jgi:tryptophan synthase alpha chain
VAAFADVVIVGSAFVSKLDEGLPALTDLATELAEGVRAKPAPVG